MAEDVRVSGSVNHYQQNFYVLARSLRYLGGMIFLAVLILALGIVMAALILAKAVA